jgi:membrane fusion protein (multidrug efflux system)
MKSLPLRAPLLCFGLVALVGCGKGSGQPPQPPTPQVGVIEAHLQSVPLTRNLVGRLSPYLSANVTARVAGVLVKRVYTEGSPVKQGQVLFEIDPAFYQTQLNNAQATLAASQATLTNNTVQAERDRQLLPKGYISKQQVDNDAAAVRTADAAVKQAQATVQAARVNLGYTKVTSPIDGIAGQQQVTVGATVGSGTGDAGASGTLLTTVQQIDQVYVNFTMSAADVSTMRQAQSKGGVDLTQQDKTTVQLTLPDGSTYDQPGMLDFSDVTVNATTGAINLRALVPNPKHVLLPGMYVNLVANLGQQNNVYLIPQQAIQRDVAGAYALVVGQDGKVARKDIVTNATSGSNWIVTDGLANGDQVIVSGVQAVQPGAPAKATPWQPEDKGQAQAGSAPAHAGSAPSQGGQPAAKQ